MEKTHRDTLLKAVQAEVALSPDSPPHYILDDLFGRRLKYFIGKEALAKGPPQDPLGRKIWLASLFRRPSPPFLLVYEDISKEEDHHIDGEIKEKRESRLFMLGIGGWDDEVAYERLPEKEKTKIVCSTFEELRPTIVEAFEKVAALASSGQLIQAKSGGHSRPSRSEKPRGRPHTAKKRKEIVRKHFGTRREIDRFSLDPVIQDLDKHNVPLPAAEKYKPYGSWKEMHRSFEELVDKTEASIEETFYLESLIDLFKRDLFDQKAKDKNL